MTAVLAVLLSAIVGINPAIAGNEQNRKGKAATQAVTQSAATATPTTPADGPAVSVTKRLMDKGLSRVEAEKRVNQLTQSDLQKFADSPEQVEMGGIKDSTLIIIAVILIVPSILLLAVV